ncbi:cache domain-containing sensor histidine kinase [Cohnella silvisoli]|uniref:Histidine kinase n=1 Tax=Cohnella silvisoli TaxID=2873699 RepID=A0ABV1KQ50_9BACL|nr:sensor histidine kinase [Cohnella silvisoli]MCD9025586.1 histidine kinase [Cohnella silvisoli]
MNKHSLRLASSFRNRVILIFFMIIIVPFLLFAYYAHIKSIEGISNANTKISMSYLLQTRKNFEIYLNRLNNQINDIIGNKQIQSLLEQRPENPAEEEAFAVNLLSLLYQKTPGIDAFRVNVFPIKPASYPTYMSMVGVSNLEKESWFLNSKATVSPIWYLNMPRRGTYVRPLLTYVKRFSGLYDQIPRGIVATDLSEDQLKRYFYPSDRMKGQKLLLLDERGTVLFDSSDNQWTGRPIPSTGFIELARSAREGSQTMAFDGTTQLATYLKMDSEPWTIVSLTPLRELTGSIREINRLLIAFLVIYLICCFAVVLYLTVYFTQPIVKLVRLMRKSESGDFPFPYLLSAREDEVGWLYRGFGSLLLKTKELIEEASRSERKKKELEFQVLSHQINPHFLYNTLESIRWKAMNHGRSDISEMVSALGNLLRLSLNQGKEITTLGHEIEQVKAYVHIEQARLGSPVRILYSFDEDTLQLPFLRLLLQPIVENAIQHSIRDNFERGKILMSARREDSDLVIEVADNGTGIPKAVLARLETGADIGDIPGDAGRGVGLRNVNERLKLYFGDAYKLQIETGAEFGTKITIRHPILKDDMPHGGSGRS